MIMPLPTYSPLSQSSLKASELHLLYHNAGGLRTKMHSVFLLSSSLQYDIIAVSETWLSENHFSSELFDCNLFNVFRKDRCGFTTGMTRGGGVLLAIRSSLLCSRIELPSDALNLQFDVDQLIVRISIDNLHDVFIILSYIPPRSSFELYNVHIDNCSKILNDIKNNQNIIILGDFNLPFINWSIDPDDKTFLIPFNVSNDSESIVVDTFSEFGLKQINCFPNSLNRFLDLVFVDTEFSVGIHNPNPPPLSNSDNHVCLSLKFSFYKYLKLQNSNLSYNFKKCKFNEISNLIISSCQPSVLNNCEINIAYNFLTNSLKEAIDLFTPKISKNYASKPKWFNKKLININNRKNKAFKLFRNSINDLVLYNKYLRLQKEFDFLNKFLYRQYVLNMETNLKKNSKCFWKFINEKKSSAGIPNIVHFDGETSSDPFKMCNLFASFFRSVYKPSVPSTIENSDSNLNLVSIGELQISSDEIEKELRMLNDDKHPGADGIVPLVLKNCAKALACPLSVIFNRSLHEGIFLDAWKLSYIHPVFKSGCKNEVCNYRPICKIPIIPKLFEKIVYNKLVFLLKEVISPLQHGFVNGRSTTTNLVVFNNYLVNSLECGFQCDVVYTDFSKAFDRVNHSILLSKLKKIGFFSSILKWLESYLTDRTQRVQINNILSDSVNVTSGVPQGSHLGPLLFLIFINDIPDQFNNCKCLMYADDIKLYVRIKSTLDCINLQRDLKRLFEWCEVNDLHLNVSKCQCMSFYRSQLPIIFPYSLGETPLARIIEKKRSWGYIRY